MDYDSVMQANLARVFGERDATRRLAALGELYTQDAVFYEPDAVAEGHAAISETVGRILSGVPADFVFTALAPAAGHHDVGRLHWKFGAPDGPAAVTGTDIVRFEGGLIKTLHVFLDAAGD